MSWQDLVHLNQEVELGALVVIIMLVNLLLGNYKALLVQADTKKKD